MKFNSTWSNPMKNPLPSSHCIPKNRCHLHHQLHLLASLAEPLRLHFVKSSADLTFPGPSWLRTFSRSGEMVESCWCAKWCGVTRFWQNRISRRSPRENLWIWTTWNCWASYHEYHGYDYEGSQWFSLAHQPFLKLATSDGEKFEKRMNPWNDK